MKESIGEVIKQARVKLGLSQDDMAEQLETTQNAYSKLERGITTMSISRLTELCRILGINTVRLVDYYIANTDLTYDDFLENIKVDEHNMIFQNPDVLDLYEAYKELSEKEEKRDKEDKFLESKYEEVINDKNKIISFLEEKVDMLKKKLAMLEGK
ncbi:helix-turn-helix domain-containing protein [Bernardetia sp. OM2101]|uniref:helix-turn-helix domain-containing protein n=1 Tax=Bernardetia sp. OM2101 TaxID=3344876 RepID=UPI0035D031CB